MSKITIKGYVDEKIESRGQRAPYVSFDTQTGELEIEAYINDRFYKIDLALLKSHLIDFQTNNNDSIRLSVMKGLVMPKPHLIYVQGDFYRDDFVPPQLYEMLIEVITSFDIRSIGKTYFPEIKGIMKDGFLKIAGESYHSYTTEFYTPILSWLEICLQKQQPNKFRIEFWMAYFNTPSAKRFQLVLDALSLYKKMTKNDVELYWYCEENDIDMIESAKIFFKSVPLINSTLVIVDNIENHEMNK